MFLPRSFDRAVIQRPPLPTLSVTQLRGGTGPDENDWRTRTKIP